MGQSTTNYEKARFFDKGVTFSFVNNGKNIWWDSSKRRLVTGRLYLLKFIFDLWEGFINPPNIAIEQLVVYGVTCSRHDLAISHLFFIDDHILFFRANVNQCQKVEEIIKCCKSALVHHVKFHKSKVVFCSN